MTDLRVGAQAAHAIVVAIDAVLTKMAATVAATTTGKTGGKITILG